MASNLVATKDRVTDAGVLRVSLRAAALLPNGNRVAGTIAGRVFALDGVGKDLLDAAHAVVVEGLGADFILALRELPADEPAQAVL
ncbi:MAG: hypothetical protein AMXMBFR58_38250 [Phycisphaerae bacterium]